MTILVAGGQGFIGSRLITELKVKGHEVFATVRNLGKSHLIAGVTYFDIEDFNSTKIPDFKTIINAAGYYSNSSVLSELTTNINSNVMFPLKLAKFITKYTESFVNLDSYLEFAPVLPGIPWSQYSASKILGRKTLEDFCVDQNVKYISCVLYDNYSENLTRRKFLDQLIIAANDREVLTVNNYVHNMDLIYIYDLIDAIIEIAVFGHSEMISRYQIRSKKSFTIKELILIADKIVGKKLRVKLAENKPDALIVSKIWDSAQDWPGTKISTDVEQFLTKMINA
jgi:nucleoside-diphosphate-sugar epimerase